MILREIIEELDLEVKSASGKLDNEVMGGYVSDLLSDVIANSEEGDIWVTLQIHQNIIAVATLKGLSGIVLVNGRYPNEETIQKAEIEGIPIMVSKLPAFEVVGRLHNLGILGAADAGGV
ncbi:serine kinase [candidate division WOR-3 bacterium]|nr:serine kinase [candidate division WOR-3 bacterium]MCK4575262.1 serine kinase [candidate division WOR-3 bacterium]